MTDGAAAFSDTETDRQTSRTRADEGGILLSLQTRFNGCTTAHVSLQQWTGEDYSKRGVKFAHLETDGDMKTEEEEPREIKKTNKGV